MLDHSIDSNEFNCKEKVYNWPAGGTREQAQNYTTKSHKCSNALSLKCIFPIFVRFGFCAMLLSPSGSTCQPRIIIQTKPNSPKSIINGHNYRTYNVDYIQYTVYPREKPIYKYCYLTVVKRFSKEVEFKLKENIIWKSSHERNRCWILYLNKYLF